MRKEVSIEAVCSYLVHHYEMEQEQAEEILETYTGVLRDTFKKLQNAITGYDGKEASCNAHALKGAYLNLGLPAQADIASTLEKELCEKIIPYHTVQLETLLRESKVLLEKR